MPTRGNGVRLDTSLETLLDRAEPGSPGVLATLVASAGSTYRKPGARMLIKPDGRYFGLLSGGCLEADLGLHARQVLESGRPQAVEYDMRGPDDILFGIGAGCEGAMRVLLEPTGPGSRAATALAAAAAVTRRGSASTLVVVHASERLDLGTFDVESLAPHALRAAAAQALAEGRSSELRFDAGGRAFVQYLAPLPHLLICGAGPDAEPVVSAALGLGWRVSVRDHRPAYAVAARFPGAAVTCADAAALRASIPLDACHAAVVMSHHLPSDVSYLRELARAAAPDYVGLLGPAARRRRIAQELGADAALLRARVRGPVGMDLGAVTPEGIALAIVSEIHAWLAGRTQMMLDSIS